MMAADGRTRLPWVTLGLLVIMVTSGHVSSQVTEKTKSNTSRPMYKVATVLSEPWMMYQDGVYKGFIADLLEKLSEQVDFDYQIQLPTEGKYGKLNYITGVLDGIVGDVMKGEADIAAADLIQSDERSKVVALTKPFMSSGTRILMQKPKLPDGSWYTLFKPFSAEVWALLVVALLLIGGELFLIDKFCPNDVEASTKGQSKNCWSKLGDSYLFAISTFLWQGYSAVPKAVSGRLVAVFWWAFTVCVILSYTANLTALILSSGNEKPIIPFSTFSDMAGQSDVSYGGWFGMVMDTQNEPQASINRFISSRYTYYHDLDEAVKRIRNSDGSYAAIVEGYAGEHLTGQNCDLILLRDELFPISYSLACRKTDGICNNLTMAILKLREDGTVYQLIQRWWSERAKCPEFREEDYVSKTSIAIIVSKALGLSEMSYAFFEILIGAILGALILIAEIIIHRRKQPKKADPAAPLKNDHDQSGV